MMAVDVSFPVPPSQFSAPPQVQVPLRRSSRLAHGAHSIFAHSHSYPSPFPQRRKRQRSVHRPDADDHDNDHDSDPLTPRALRALKRARLSPVADDASADLPPQPPTHRTRRRKENAIVEDGIKRHGDTQRPATKRPSSPPRAQQHATPLSIQRLQGSDNLPLDVSDNVSSHPSISIPDLSSTKSDTQQSSPAPRSITPALSAVDEFPQTVSPDSRSASSCSPLTPLTPSPEFIPAQLPPSPPSNAVPDEELSPPGIVAPSENDYAFAMNVPESATPTSFASQPSNVPFCEAPTAASLSSLHGPSDPLMLGANFSQAPMELENSYPAQESFSDQASQRAASSARGREINIWKLACQERVDIMVRRYGPETIKALVAAEATQDDHYSATLAESSDAPIAGLGPNTTRFRLYTPANYTYGSSLNGGDEEDDDLSCVSTHRSSYEGELECDYDEEEDDDDDYEDFEDDFGDAEMETSGGATTSVTSNPVSNENAGSIDDTAPDDNPAGQSPTGSENEIPSAEVPAGHGQESDAGVTRVDLDSNSAACSLSMNFDVPFSSESSSSQFASPIAQSESPSQETPQNHPSPSPDLSSNAAYPQEFSSPQTHLPFRAPQDSAFSRFRTPFRVPRLSSLQVSILSEPPRAFMGRGTPPNRQRATDWASGSSSPPSPSPLPRSLSGPDLLQPSSQSEIGAALDMVNQNPGPGEWTSFLYAMLGSDNNLLPGTPTLSTGTESGVPISVQENPAGSGASWYEMGLGGTSVEHTAVAMSPSPIPSEGESSELRFALG